jgi:hypothetical protein
MKFYKIQKKEIFTIAMALKESKTEDRPEEILATSSAHYLALEVEAARHRGHRK